MEDGMLDVRVGIGLGEDRNGRAIHPGDSDAIVDRICRLAAKATGGYTTVDCDGGWTNGEGRLVKEPGIILYVMFPESVRTDTIRNFAKLVGRAANQECVVLSYNARSGIVKCWDTES